MIGLPQLAGQFKKLQGLLQGDGIHPLVRSQPGEPGLFLVLLGADLDKGAEAAHPYAHRPVGFGIGTQLPSLDRFLPADALGLVLHPLPERLPEGLHQGHPVLLPPGDLVQFVLQPGGEVVVHILVEMLGQKAVDDPAHVGGLKATLVQYHVFPGQQGGNDGGIGGGPTDTILLQGLDQAGLAIAGGRLGKVLLRADGQQIHPLPLLQGR